MSAPVKDTRDDVFADVLDAASTRRRHGRGARRAWRAGTERRQGVRIARATDLGPEAWTLELHPVRYLEALADEIAALHRRAAEPNVFFSPPVLRAAFPRLARGRGGAAWLMCLYREGDAGARQLVLFAPLALPRPGWPPRPAVAVAATEYTPLGTPLVDRAHLAEAAERCLSLLADPALALPPVLLLPEARMDGPVAAAFRAAAARNGLAAVTHGLHTRAVLRPGQDHALSRRRERDTERQLRGLRARGTVRFEEARSEAAVLDAFEAFVALELASWKGHGGTALYNNKRIVAFSREAVAGLAREGACTIFSLTLDGRTLASLIVLGDPTTGESATWKTAYDAAHAAHSPGVLLLLHATRVLAGGGEPAGGDGPTGGGLVDSLARPGHPVMERVWRDRVAMGTLLLATSSDARPPLRALAAAMRRRERVRDWVLCWLRGLCRDRLIRAVRRFKP